MIQGDVTNLAEGRTEWERKSACARHRCPIQRTKAGTKPTGAAFMPVGLILYSNWVMRLSQSREESILLFCNCSSCMWGCLGVASNNEEYLGLIIVFDV